MRKLHIFALLAVLLKRDPCAFDLCLRFNGLDFSVNLLNSSRRLGDLALGILDLKRKPLLIGLCFGLSLSRLQLHFLHFELAISLNLHCLGLSLLQFGLCQLRHGFLVAAVALSRCHALGNLRGLVNEVINQTLQLTAHTVRR